MTGGRHRRKPGPRSRAGNPARRGKGSLSKAPTGIAGLDEITNGGLPCTRATLVCGGPGAGKTLLATQFLAHGALAHAEPGVFMSFEESPEQLAANSLSVGFDLKELSARRQLLVDYVHLDRNEVVESGGYDLDGSLRIGARRRDHHHRPHPSAD